jgi:hypothetical protein
MGVHLVHFLAQHLSQRQFSTDPLDVRKPHHCDASPVPTAAPCKEPDSDPADAIKV